MSHFHERRQKAGESVDSFAQDLRGLYHKAYPSTSRGSKETEEMGQTVLANQFAAGLLPELKAKVAGSEGDLEKLLQKQGSRRPNCGICSPSQPRRSQHRPLCRSLSSQSRARRVCSNRGRLQSPISTVVPNGIWLTSALNMGGLNRSNRVRSISRSGSLHGRQNHHWRLCNDFRRLLSCLDRQIGDCTAVVYVL